MSLNQISQRLEIAFWTGWVQVAVNLRSTWVAPILVLAVACLLALGLARASAAYFNGSFAQAAQPAAVENVARPNTQQENYLLGWVDELHTGGQLEGLWLVVHNLPENSLTFLPLMPSQQPGSGSDFSGSYQWSPGTAIDPALLDAVNRKGIYWDHYLILEHASISGLLNLAGELNLSGRRLSPDQALAEMSQSIPAELALQRQAEILENLCQNWERVFENADLDLMSSLWLTNSASNQSEAHFEQTWQALRETGGPTCEFPTVLRR